MRRHVRKFAVESVGRFAALLLAAWTLIGFDMSGMGLHGMIALALGIALTCWLAVALMAAVFASDRSGVDSRASGPPRTGT